MSYDAFKRVLCWTVVAFMTWLVLLLALAALATGCGPISKTRDRGFFRVTVANDSPDSVSIEVQDVSSVSTYSLAYSVVGGKVVSTPNYALGLRPVLSTVATLSATVGSGETATFYLPLDGAATTSGPLPPDAVLVAGRLYVRGVDYPVLAIDLSVRWP